MATAFLNAPGPLAFAHRGGAAHAPENSWRAFEHAVGLGYRYLETDLQATADGVLVAFHDRTLTRVCGQDGRVCRLSHAELSAARIAGTEPIPLLEDLLGAWPDVRFNLDVKGVPAAARLRGVRGRRTAWDGVWVVSSAASRLRAPRRALGRPVCMAASPFGTAMVRFGGPRGRRDRRGPGQQGPRQPARPRPQRPLADWLARTGVPRAPVPAPLAPRAGLRPAPAPGLPVPAWTVNDRPAMERLLDLGIDGIMTDETVALRDVLAARHQWHPRHPSGQQ